MVIYSQKDEFKKKGNYRDNLIFLKRYILLVVVLKTSNKNFKNKKLNR